MSGEIYREENNIYQIDFSSAIWSTNKLNRVFHSTVSSILSDVDFVAETDKEILFVEYKNANINGAVNPDAFKPSEDKYINKIAYKFYDSLIYIMACGYRKPYKYVYILEYPLGDTTTRRFIRNKISSKLPFQLQNDANIKNKLISSFEVMSIKEWNDNELYHKFPIRPIENEVIQE